MSHAPSPQHTALSLAASGVPVLPLRRGKVPFGNCTTCADKMFKECIPEGQQAGACGGQSTCSQTQVCPMGTTPGVLDGCVTGSCIPDQFCPIAA